MVYKYDFLIIGAGVAGMSYALKIARAHKGKICLICKNYYLNLNHHFLIQKKLLVIYPEKFLLIISIMQLHF